MWDASQWLQGSGFSSPMHVVLSRQLIMCGNVYSGVYAGTGKVKTLTERNKMLPIDPTKVLESISHAQTSWH